MIKTKIKYYRNLRGLTQKQLSIKCNIAQSHVSRLENNVESPTLRVLENIASVLNVCVYELIESNCNNCKYIKKED